MENKLLKVASILLIIFGLLSGGVTIFNGVKAVNETRAYAAENYADLEALVANESDGMFGVDEVTGVVSIIAYVVIGVGILWMVLRVIVGVMGLARANRPEKNKFFTIWGVILLVFGVFGLGALFSLVGLLNAVAGVACPILFLIGASQQKKALMTAQQGPNPAETMGIEL